MIARLKHISGAVFEVDDTNWRVTEIPDDSEEEDFYALLKRLHSEFPPKDSPPNAPMEVARNAAVAFKHLSFLNFEPGPPRDPDLLY